MKERILIVADESNIRNILNCLLEERGYRITEASNGEEALRKIDEQTPDIILLDLEMPVMSGLDTLKELKKKGCQSKVIIVTAYGTISRAVEAMRLGAHDYVTKPFNSDEMIMVVEKALQHVHMEKELLLARDRLNDQFSVKGIITGNSRMLRLLDTIEREAPSDNPVLITGESGTGKELFANAVHQHSGRKAGPLMALNCADLPETLVESELFGYKKGAFSGATQAKEGLVERADGGSLFLDEIGEMGNDAQVKLLRFAESGEFIPVGGTRPEKVNVRLIAASNRDVENSVSEGHFKADLYYRLNVIRLSIPPLRERLDDIPLLVDHFLSKHGQETREDPFRITPEALRALQLHNWPGNVRELEKIVKCAITMSPSNVIDEESLPVLSDLQSPVCTEPVGEGTLQEIMADHMGSVEVNALSSALDSCDGNKSHAAKKLGICRNTLKRKMKQYGLG